MPSWYFAFNGIVFKLAPFASNVLSSKYLEALWLINNHWFFMAQNILDQYWHGHSINLVEPARNFPRRILFLKSYYSNNIVSTLSFAFNSRRNHKSVKLYFPGRLCGPRLLWHGGPYLPFCPQTPAPGKDCFAERKSREPAHDGAFQFQERMWGQILGPSLRLSHASLRCHASRRNFSLLGQKVNRDCLVPWRGHLRIETIEYLTWF